MFHLVLNWSPDITGHYTSWGYSEVEPCIPLMFESFSLFGGILLVFKVLYKLFPPTFIGFEIVDFSEDADNVGVEEKLFASSSQGRVIEALQTCPWPNIQTKKNTEHARVSSYQ